MKAQPGQLKLKPTKNFCEFNNAYRSYILLMYAFTQLHLLVTINSGKLSNEI